jgi:hypothetical protein
VRDLLVGDRRDQDREVDVDPEDRRPCRPLAGAQDARDDAQPLERRAVVGQRALVRRAAREVVVGGLGQRVAGRGLQLGQVQGVDAGRPRQAATAP